ncbi:MAG: DUF2769 domain-containing protein [Halobacteriota archaeon]
MLKKKPARVENTNPNFEKCLCYTERCPTYNRNGLTGALFCARGRSEKTLEKKGCVCPSCPIWVDCKLNAIFFCAHGAAE